MAKIAGRTLAHKALEHLRTLAVKRVVEDGEAPSAVMDSLGRCRTSIYPWLREFKDKGWAAPAERIARGPEPKLTEKQRQPVRRWILGKAPRQYGMDYGLWSRRNVPTLIAERMQIQLGLTAVSRLLASLEITPQKPLRRAQERDPKLGQEWLADRYPKLKQRDRELGAKMLFLDEAGLQSDPILGRTQGLKGKTPVVKTSGRRQRINVISAVNGRGEFWAAIYGGKLAANTFVAFRKDFLKRQGGKILLVLDGLAVRHAPPGQAYLAGLAGRLELHKLPPYCPD